MERNERIKYNEKHLLNLKSKETQTQLHRRRYLTVEFGCCQQNINTPTIKKISLTYIRIENLRK